MPSIPADEYTAEETASGRPTSSADFPAYRVSSPRSLTGVSISGTRQVGGDHYRKRKIQPWDYIAANDLDFWQGSIVKYITRWRDKGGVEDLKKARHTLDKYIELQEEK